MALKAQRKTVFLYNYNVHVWCIKEGDGHGFRCLLKQHEIVVSLLRKGYSIRDVAKLSGKGVSSVQRVKRLLKMQSPQ